MANTILDYAGGLPTVTGTVTLFNSATAFPPGGSLHLLRQDWYQYTLRVASDGGAATGTVTGSYSLDKGTTWVPFYSKSITDADDDNAAAAADVIADEVYIGMFKDVRFQYTKQGDGVLEGVAQLGELELLGLDGAVQLGLGDPELVVAGLEEDHVIEQAAHDLPFRAPVGAEPRGRTLSGKGALRRRATSKSSVAASMSPSFIAASTAARRASSRPSIIGREFWPLPFSRLRSPSLSS